jgi:porin
LDPSRRSAGNARVVAFTLALASTAAAQEPVPPVLREEHRHEESDATAPPGGASEVRTALARHGLAIEAFLTSDLSRLLDGGRDPGAWSLRGLFDLVLTAESEALGFPGGHFLLDFQHQDGDDGSEDVGDLQGYSNIDADGRTQIAKIWWEQRFLDERLVVRTGKMDANAQFAWTEHGSRFLGSSMGYSPTILSFPTFPDPAFGATVHGHVGASVELGLGVFDGATHEGFRTGSRGPSTLFGAPSDLFWIAQADLSWGAGPDRLPGRVGVGAWRHTGTFDRFDGGEESGTTGSFLVLDQALWAAHDGTERHMGGFLQLGFADHDVAAIDSHVGAGLAWQGPLRSREHDVLGLGFSRAGLSDEAGAGFGADSEFAIETFYSWRASPWLRVKPDLQYILDPGGDPDLDPALVLTLRVSFSF